MKTVATLIVLLQMFAAQVDAQVIVWKNKFSLTITSGGLVEKQSLTGFTILDWATKSFIRVDIFPTMQVYRVTDNDQYRVTKIAGPGKEYTVFSLSRDDDGVSDSILAKGINAPTDIGTWPGDPVILYRIPKSLRLTSNSVFTGDSGLALEEGKGTMALDLTLTRSSNIMGYTAQDVVEFIEMDLFSYTRVDW